MKYLSRLTALLLAFVLLFSSSVGVIAESDISDLTRSGYDQMVSAAKEAAEAEAAAAAQEAASQPIINEGGVVYEQDIPEQTKRFDIYEVITDAQLSMGSETEITLPQSGKINLSAGTAAQWQIYIPGADMWVNIAGETGDTFALTYAVIGGMLSGGSAKVRALAGDSAAVANVSVAYGSALPLVEEEDTFVAEAAAASTFSLRRSASTSDANAGIMLLAEDGAEAEADVADRVDIVVQYLFAKNGDTAAQPYTANVAIGSDFTATVTFPEIEGYLPYVEEEDEASESLTLSYDNITEAQTITVWYKPTTVSYTVKYMLQNVDGEGYTEDTTRQKTMYGLTDDTVPDSDDIKIKIEGFNMLFFDRPAIAADGSTVVEVYYDRVFYLMLFELDGGYGVEPIYARYGAAVSVGTPEKPGYTFAGWDPTVPSTMPAGGGTYTAKWGNAQTVNYTVVYWRENADDNGYSFWGSEIKQAVAGTKVSGGDTVPTSISNATINGETVDEKPYFTYLDSRTDKNVEIAGDGSSVVNVYYTRNYYTILFTGYGKCSLEEHTHSTACQTLICGVEQEHTHDETCTKTLVCTTEEHTHSSACCNLSTTHTHTTSCYDNVGNRVTNTYGFPTPTGDGYIYRTGSGRDTRRYIYINGSWYSYNANSGQTGSIASTNNSCPGTHTHGDGKCSCSQEEHTHSDDSKCYTYSCGLIDHKHDSSCYQDCNKPTHTHTSTCTSNNTSNVIYSITAKYDQTIGDIWPTYDVLKAGEYAYEDSSGNVANSDDQKFRGWKIDGHGNTEAVSKRVNMTSDLCDTSDGVKYANAQYGAKYTYRLYYMFESFDQSSTAQDATTDGTARRRYNNLWYDSDPVYYQELVYNSETTFNQKEITGMDPVSVEETTDNSIIYNYLYYTRNRYTLTFQNVDTVTKTVSDIMFEQPLENYTDGYGNKISEYVLTDDQYPIASLHGAYKFDGWYTTPECYEGTKFNFTGATMPNGDLALYASWVPVNRNVKVYLTDAKTQQLGETITVPHGSKVAEDDIPATPTNGNMKFVGWFYMDGNTEKAFDFNNMPVNKDLEIYAKWSDDTVVTYFVYYRAKDSSGNVIVDENGNPLDIAEPATGSALANTSRTFEAKSSDELIAPYNEGYFPDVKSHNVVLSATEDNVWIFYYSPVDAVPYTVKYLEAGTNAVLHEEKVVSDNRKAVVTENFEIVPGYMPDAYQKRLVVSADGKGNEIIFYYTKDEEHAYYMYTHYLQNLDGTTYTHQENLDSQAIGNVPSTISHQPQSIAGYTYVESKTELIVGEEKILGTSATLTTSGLEIRHYYDRNSYPYTVRYLEKDTNKVLHAEKTTGTGLYGDVVSENAIAIEGYECISLQTQTCIIKIDDGEGEPENLIIFYYQENECDITYVVDGPTGCGTVDLNDGDLTGPATSTSEEVKETTGTALGATAAVSSNAYKFVGWYDAQGNKLSDEWEFIPAKVDGKNVTATYYAKFEMNISTLTISKTGMESNETAIFTVKATTEDKQEKTFIVTVPNNGSVTIANLIIGTDYTVTENTDWTWRYSSSVTSGDDSGTIAADGSSVAFENKSTTDKWLSDEDSQKNNFGAVN